MVVKSVCSGITMSAAISH